MPSITIIQIMFLFRFLSHKFKKKEEKITSQFVKSMSSSKTKQKTLATESRTSEFPNIRDKLPNITLVKRLYLILVSYS